MIEGVRGVVQNGVQGFLGMHIEDFELFDDSCRSGNCGVWDLLVCGV